MNEYIIFSEFKTSDGVQIHIKGSIRNGFNKTLCNEEIVSEIRELKTEVTCPHCKTIYQKKWNKSDG